MGSIITKDDRPISWTPLSPERSTGASMTHNNTLQKQWILKGRHFGGGGEDGSLQSSYYTFTLNLSLSVRWASSPLLTQWGSIQERIRGGVGEKLHRCHNMIKKKKRQKMKLCNRFHFASTLSHSTISINWASAEESSLRPFSGEGSLLWPEKNSMLFYT